MITYGGKDWEGAVFDLDGTILDSMGVWEIVDRRFLENNGLPFEKDYIQDLLTMHFAQAAEYTKKRYTMEKSEAQIMEEWFAIAKGMYAGEVELKPHAAEYLAVLRERGVKIAAATSSDPLLYEPALKRNGVYDYFQAFALSSETEHGKETAEVYELAAKRIRVPLEKCIVFEDILKGVQNARAAGCYTVAVEDASSSHDAEKIRREADIYICDYLQLKEIEQ